MSAGPLRRLASLGVDDSMAPTVAEHVVFTNVFALLALGLVVLSAPLLVSAGLVNVLVTALVAVCGGAILLLNQRRRHVAAAVLVFALILGGSGAHTFVNGFRSGGMLYMLLAVVLPFLYLPRERERLAALLSGAAAALYLAAGQWSEGLDAGALVDEPASYVSFALIAIGASVVVIGYAERRVARATRSALLREQRSSETLLAHLVPQPFMRRLLDAPAPTAKPYAEVTVLRSEIADLASMSERLAPEQLVTMFDELFTAFDAICSRREGVALNTVGDVYSAAFGFEVREPEPGDSRVGNRPARAAVEMAVEMLACVDTLRGDYPGLELRIGMSTGDVVVAVLGVGGARLDVVGSAAVEALHLARSGPDGQIHVDEATMDLIAPLPASRVALVLEQGQLEHTLEPGRPSLNETLIGERDTDESLAAEVMPEPGMVLAGAYRLGQPIGQGGVGTVFRGVQLSLQREVAIKLLRFDRRHSSAAFARFEREIDVVSRLSHPNIVQVIDAGRTQTGLTYLVMELLVGQPLASYVPEGGLSRELALVLFEQICSGVRAAHNRGLIHRDLAPKNVFLIDVGVTEDEAELQVKLLDFGLVKTREPQAERLTRDDQIAGTPGFMAPEQINHEHDIEPYTDIYALGCLLYFMLCGQHAFEGPGLGRILFNQLEGQHRGFAAGHAGLTEVIDRALSPAPKDRFESVEDMVTQLREAAREEGVLQPRGRFASSKPVVAAPHLSLIEGEPPPLEPLVTLSSSVEGTLETNLDE